MDASLLGRSPIKIGVVLASILLVSIQLLPHLVRTVRAFMIEVDVVNVLEAEVVSFDFNSTTSLGKMRLEIRNRGSIAYSARTRIDVYDTPNSSEAEEVGELFTAWSGEMEMMPGDRKNVELYWYNNESGDVTIRVRIYYANEIFEKFYEVEKDEPAYSPTSATRRDIFNFKEFRVYDEFIIFDLVAKEEVGDIIIIPSSFTRGWVFEQREVGSMKWGASRPVVIPYQATVFAEDDLTLSVVAGDSMFYSEKTFTLKKNKGLKRLLFGFVDRLKLHLSRQL
jgi:hypothetical protein